MNLAYHKIHTDILADVSPDVVRGVLTITHDQDDRAALLIDVQGQITDGVKHVIFRAEDFNAASVTIIPSRSNPMQMENPVLPDRTRSWAD